MVFNKIFGFFSENLKCGIETIKRLTLYGSIKSCLFNRNPRNSIQVVFETMTKYTLGIAVVLLDKTHETLDTVKEYICEEDNMRALRSDVLSFIFFHIVWVCFMIKDTFFRLKHEIKLKWTDLRCKNSFSHLSDYRYNFNDTHTYPYRKLVEIVGHDEKEKEIKLNELQVSAVKNIGSVHNNISLREIISFCGLSYRISSLEFSYISFMGQKKVWLRDE